jgi:lactoylglutathione lyase
LPSGASTSNERAFYEKYFEAVANTRYRNAAQQFESYFLSFSSGTRIGLIQRPDVSTAASRVRLGYDHAAISWLRKRQ